MYKTSNSIIDKSEAISADPGMLPVQHSLDNSVSENQLASVKDALNAANTAAAAFPAWSQTEPAVRAGVLQRAADLLNERVNQFVEIMVREIGSTQSWARFNCGLAADIFRQAAELVHFDTKTVRKGRDKHVTSYIVRQPVGVVLGIAPWNAPIVLGCRAIAIPLACGNTTVLKASELCPGVHGMIIEALKDAGLPDGAANLVTNVPEEAGVIVDALIGHPAVRRINFTGSTRVGRIVAQTCARHLKNVVLELSGKAPQIVLNDADIDAAVGAAVFSSFFNQGQICISTERVIVERDVADEFANKITARAKSLKTGDSREAEYPIGSMISSASAQRVNTLVEEALSRGAELLAGGRVDGKLMQPTVLDKVDSSMRIYHEESFGPVCAIIRCSGEDEAVSIANDTAYGLASSVFSRDITRAGNLAERLESGVCHINGPTVYDDPSMPFGGVKDSGYGKLGGEEAVREFTELRWISVHDGPHHYPI